MAIRGDNINRYGKLSALADSLLRVMSRRPIATCCIIGFLSGSLLDLDHLPLWLFHFKYPVLIYIGGPHPLGQGRNLHGLALVGGGLMCAYAGGSILLVVLEELVDRIKIWLRKNLSLGHSDKLSSNKR